MQNIFIWNNALNISHTIAMRYILSVCDVFYRIPSHSDAQLAVTVNVNDTVNVTDNVNVSESVKSNIIYAHAFLFFS